MRHVVPSWTDAQIPRMEIDVASVFILHVERPTTSPATPRRIEDSRRRLGSGRWETSDPAYGAAGTSGHLISRKELETLDCAAAPGVCAYSVVGTPAKTSSARNDVGSESHRHGGLLQHIAHGSPFGAPHLVFASRPAQWLRVANVRRAVTCGGGIELPTSQGNGGDWSDGSRPDRSPNA